MHTNLVGDVAISPNGRVLASAGECIYTYIGHTGGVEAVAVSPDGETLASSGADETIRLWDLQTRAHFATFQIAGPYAHRATSNGDLY